MATGYVNLSPSVAVPPDGSTGNAAPALIRFQGSESNPKKHFLIYAFDAATDEMVWFVFEVPGDYASGGAVDLLWMANATTGTCRWQVGIGAVTPADVDTPVEHAGAAVSTAGTATNATEARRLNSTSITLANLDSLAANDLAFLFVSRDADGTSGTDDLAVDAELISVRFTYTTT